VDKTKLISLLLYERQHLENQNLRDTKPHQEIRIFKKW